MTVYSAAEGIIALQGYCPSEEAEVLLQHLLATPSAGIDLQNCDSAHSAVVQVLLALKPRIVGLPSDNPWWDWIRSSLNCQV